MRIDEKITVHEYVESLHEEIKKLRYALEKVEMYLKGAIHDLTEDLKK